MRKREGGIEVSVSRVGNSRREEKQGKKRKKWWKKQRKKTRRRGNKGGRERERAGRMLMYFVNNATLMVHDKRHLEEKSFPWQSSSHQPAYTLTSEAVKTGWGLKAT